MVVVLFISLQYDEKSKNGIRGEDNSIQIVLVPPCSSSVKKLIQEFLELLILLFRVKWIYLYFDTKGHGKLCLSQ